MNNEGGRGKWWSYTRYELLVAAPGSCQGRRHACGSSRHSYELRGQSREFSSISTSPFRWWCKVIRRGVCRSGVFKPAYAPKYYGPYICGWAGAAARSAVNTAAAGAARSKTQPWHRCGGCAKKSCRGVWEVAAAHSFQYWFPQVVCHA